MKEEEIRSARNYRIIDPEAIRQNMSVLRASVPKSAKVMAVVKADGYGHGAVTVAKAALSGGAEALAVAVQVVVPMSCATSGLRFPSLSI